jgi:ariadne-1
MAFWQRVTKPREGASLPPTNHTTTTEEVVPKNPVLSPAIPSKVVPNATSRSPSSIHAKISAFELKIAEQPSSSRQVSAPYTLPLLSGECALCMENSNHIVNIGHSLDTGCCQQCLTGWIETKLSEALQPICPTCMTSHLPYRLVSELIKNSSPQIRERFGRLGDSTALQQGFVWCANPDCTNSQRPDANGIIICRACGTSTCATHQELVARKPVNGISVCCRGGYEVQLEQERQQREMEGQASSYLLQNQRAMGIIKPCPSCHVAIEKNEGCRHMTCRCGHEFFWCCLRSYRDPTEAQNHRRSCP